MLGKKCIQHYSERIYIFNIFVQGIIKIEVEKLNTSYFLNANFDYRNAPGL